jgi:predicted membrane GTPase involved in stress response
LHFAHAAEMMNCGFEPHNNGVTVMTFDYNDLRINILNTPGHQDFSEDTYRWVVIDVILAPAPTHPDEHTP